MAKALASQSALGAYRKLLRTVATTFKGDDVTLLAAKREIRQKFEDNKELGDPSALPAMVAEAYDAAEFIRTHVVQAEQNEKGNYAMKLEQHHATEEKGPEK
jgi:complex III assembly factor LYRM7